MRGPSDTASTITVASAAMSRAGTIRGGRRLRSDCSMSSPRLAGTATRSTITCGAYWSTSVSASTLSCAACTTYPSPSNRATMLDRVQASSAMTRTRFKTLSGCSNMVNRDALCSWTLQQTVPDRSKSVHRNPKKVSALARGDDDQSAFNGPLDHVTAAAEAELAQNPARMRLGSPIGDDQLVSDLFIAEAERQQLGDLLLAIGQRRQPARIGR